MNKTGKLFIIAAPSGTGKTTIALQIISRLEKKIPLSRIITYTTRPIRLGEQNGRDYFFLEKKEFLKKIAQNFFLEVNNYNGECYGSPSSFINEMQQGKSFIMVTDRSGAITLKKSIPETVTIWISPPSLQELELRLKKRGTENDTEIRKRLAIAQREIALEQQDPVFQVHIVNTVLEDTVETLCVLIEQEINKIPLKI